MKKNIYGIAENDEPNQGGSGIIIQQLLSKSEDDDTTKTADELIVKDAEFIFKNIEKEKRSAELLTANQELLFQNAEKEKRAAELVISNIELLFQNNEKEKRAAELVIANQELLFQNAEKEKLAAELVIANVELVFQNAEKEKRAAELVIANKELAFQNLEKEKRAAELVIANEELLFQIRERETTTAANVELIYQNNEKEKREIELIIACDELRKAEYHINELNLGLMERTTQLENVNKELESFSYSVSHDLRAPLRAINGFTKVFLEDYLEKLDEDARSILDEIIANSNKMGLLIDNLLEFSRIGKKSLSLGKVVMKDLIHTVIADLVQLEPLRKRRITVNELENINGDRNMLTQVFINLISNAFKYTGKKEEACIEIGSYRENEYCIYYVKDNGAGFDMMYYDKLFGVFQRLHSNNDFEGTGVGLAIIQRIVAKHGGKVWAEAKVDKGACFYISLPSKLS